MGGRVELGRKEGLRRDEVEVELAGGCGRLLICRRGNKRKVSVGKNVCALVSELGMIVFQRRESEREVGAL